MRGAPRCCGCGGSSATPAPRRCAASAFPWAGGPGPGPWTASWWTWPGRRSRGGPGDPPGRAGRRRARGRAAPAAGPDADRAGPAADRAGGAVAGRDAARRPRRGRRARRRGAVLARLRRGRGPGAGGGLRARASHPSLLRAAAARLVVFALALATVPSSAALAAGVPWRARVDGRVLLRWAARTVGTTLFGVGVVGATALLPRTGTPVATVAAGVLAVTAAVVAGAVVALRRPHALTRSAPTPEP